VARDVAPYSIVAGNPGRVIRSRFLPEVVAQLLALAWWDWPVDRIRAAVPALMAADLATLEALAPRA